MADNFMARVYSLERMAALRLAYSSWWRGISGAGLNGSALKMVIAQIIDLNHGAWFNQAGAGEPRQFSRTSAAATERSVAA
jgi:hypothetical protein